MANKINGAKYYKSLSEEQQKLAKDVMMSTMDVISEILDEPIVFTESVAYKAMIYEVFGHMIENEYYDHKNKVWKKYD